MQTNWAAENLQTIRTLMERSAVYRRALAPIMSFCGIVGIAGGLVGWQMRISSIKYFVFFWAGAAVICMAGSLLLVRRQALKDSEPFWSPPTRRVTQALIPPFFIGAVLGATLSGWGNDACPHSVLIMVWSWIYGCAIYSAGFFMPRGFKLFGWIFILAGCGLLGCLVWWDEIEEISPHLLMGGIFGGLHLAYGVYLYFTESRKSVT